jgi:hypothetical protein
MALTAPAAAGTVTAGARKSPRKRAAKQTGIACTHPMRMRDRKCNHHAPHLPSLYAQLNSIKTFKKISGK